MRIIDNLVTGLTFFRATLYTGGTRWYGPTVAILRLRSDETRSPRQSDANPCKFGNRAFDAAGTHLWNYSVSADGSQTAGLVIEPFQTVAEDVSIWPEGPRRRVKPPLNSALEILLLTNDIVAFVQLRLRHRQTNKRTEGQRNKRTDTRDRIWCILALNVTSGGNILMIFLIIN